MDKTLHNWLSNPVDLRSRNWWSFAIRFLAIWFLAIICLVLVRWLLLIVRLSIGHSWVRLCSGFCHHAWLGPHGLILLLKGSTFGCKFCRGSDSWITIIFFILLMLEFKRYIRYAVPQKLISMKKKIPQTVQQTNLQVFTVFTKHNITVNVWKPKQNFSKALLIYQFLIDKNISHWEWC